MSETFYWVGVVTCIGASAVLSAFILAAGFWALGFAGRSVYKRLTRIYHLHVIFYWLDRLEKEGAHCFEKAGETK